MAFVLTDGGWLPDPTFLGKGWVIRCDDLDGLRLVFRSRAQTLKAIRARARRILRDAGVPADIDGVEWRSGVSTFPPSYKGLHPSREVPLVLHGSVPSNISFVSIGAVGEPPKEALRYGEVC